MSPDNVRRKHRANPNSQRRPRHSTLAISCKCHQPALGHHFGADLVCACGRTYVAHCAEPVACEGKQVVWRQPVVEEAAA